MVAHIWAGLALYIALLLMEVDSAPHTCLRSSVIVSPIRSCLSITYRNIILGLSSIMKGLTHNLLS